MRTSIEFVPNLTQVCGTSIGAVPKIFLQVQSAYTRNTGELQVQISTANRQRRQRQRKQQCRRCCPKKVASDSWVETAAVASSSSNNKTEQQRSSSGEAAGAAAASNFDNVPLLCALLLCMYSPRMPPPRSDIRLKPALYLKARHTDLGDNGPCCYCCCCYIVESESKCNTDRSQLACPSRWQGVRYEYCK